MLDYDGTLAPFRVKRLEAKPYPGVTGALKQLAGAGHKRLVIVSGRPVQEVELLLGDIPAAEIWGAHGWERRTADGRMEIWTPPASVSDALKKAATRLQGHLPATSLETKSGAVVVHTRALSISERERAAAKVRDRWASLASEESIELREFDGGLEMRAIARTKGTVVKLVRAECDTGAFLAYLGDDITDEDAFAELSPPDWPILVRATPRPTGARYWLAPPTDLLRFIKSWTATAS
jgi:trehalose-phosphatase